MAIRVTENNQDFGRCGCGRRDYCDGSHALSEAQWQAKLAAEQQSQPLTHPAPAAATDGNPQ